MHTDITATPGDHVSVSLSSHFITPTPFLNILCILYQRDTLTVFEIRVSLAPHHTAFTQS